MIRLAALTLCLLWPMTGHAADDPYSCFGSMRYVAMAEGLSCTDLRSFCSAARDIYVEAGRDKTAAGKLAKERGHNAMSIMLANRWCKP